MKNLLLLFLLVHFGFVRNDEKTVQQHLEQARNAMLKGDFKTASAQYSAAIDLDGKNFNLFVMRGNLNKIMGKINSALADYNSALAIKPDHDKALIGSVECLLKTCRFEEAINIMAKHNLEYVVDLNTVHELQNNFASLSNSNTEETRNTEINNLNKHLTHCPLFNELKLRFYSNTKNYMMAARTVSAMINLHPENNTLYIMLSEMYLNQCEIVSATNAVRNCLITDHDNVHCGKLHSVLKRLTKNWQHHQNYENLEILQKISKELKKLNSILTNLKKPSHCTEFKEKLIACALYVHDPAQTKESFKDNKACAELKETFLKNGNFDFFESNSEKCDAIITISEAYLKAEMPDVSKQVNGKCLEASPNYEKAKEMLSKIDRFNKNKSKRDYYKILSVDKKATKSQIVKAYRRKAIEWHPDKHRGEQEQLLATKMMKDVNDARQVLEDEGMRKIFDAGFDPLDKEDMDQYNMRNGGGGQNFFYNFFRNNQDRVVFDF